MIKIIKACFFLLLTGILGALFCQTPAGFNLEEDVGLTWLFQLRGELPPPADVIIISLDQASVEILHLPDDPANWSRSFYASLLEKLNEQNPALVAFNIHFGNSRDSEKDALLANAIAKNKNVVLSSYLKQYSISNQEDTESIYSERIIEPIPVLSQAALCTSPFPIPKTSSTVKEFWTFKHSAGGIPTFPVSIFQFFAMRQAYPEMIETLNQINPKLFSNFPSTFNDLVNKSKTASFFYQVQSALTKDKAALAKFERLLAASHYSSQVNRLLDSWLKLIKERERLYLNYYGDVGAITTIPFYQVIAPEGVDPNVFRNKIVLVGYADNLEPEKQQGFYSAFSKASGQVISPIEIAATAVANIVDQSWLKPMPRLQQSLLVLVWGVFLSALFRWFSYRAALISSLLSISVYMVLSWYAFSFYKLWPPLIIPLLQASALLLFESTQNYRKIRKLSGYYLPKEVFAINTSYPEDIGGYGILKEGVCLATDAGQYTSLSEYVSPLQLHKVMNDYYAAIFPIVKKSGGIISDVIGDAMLAVWAREKIDEKLRISACHAALEIKASIDDFNQNGEYLLPTRIGLHYGEMRLGNVGSMEHYEFRAVGDTVNTASRIEGLNKLLETRILASAPVLDKLTGICHRELGTFLLKGKNNPVKIHELIATSSILQEQPQLEELLTLYSQALHLFYDGNWKAALGGFNKIVKKHPYDGPSLFYINYLRHELSLPAKTKNEQAIIINVGNHIEFLP